MLKLALLTPSELGRWDFFISFSHQLHLAGEAVALFLIAWDVLFPPVKSSKELVLESPKSSPEGLNNLAKTDEKAMKLRRRAKLVLGEYLVHFLNHVGSSVKHLRTCDDTPLFCLNYYCRRVKQVNNSVQVTVTEQLTSAES